MCDDHIEDTENCATSDYLYGPVLSLSPTEESCQRLQEIDWHRI